MPYYLLLVTMLFGFQNISAQPLHVGVWGGAHAIATGQLLIDPFAVNSETEVVPVSNDDSLENRIAAGDVDVIQMELHDAIAACDRGDISLLPVHQLMYEEAHAVVEDFVPNTLQPCSIGQFIWSSLPVFSKSRMHSHPPILIGDFFNTTDFPGKRAMVKSPRNIAEWALAASGIDRTSIYQELSSDSAWPLINRKLSEISDEIVWVNDDAEALALVENGYAAFAVVQSNSALHKMLDDKTDLGLIWDAAITHVNVFAIPLNTRQFSKAWQFVQFASSVEVSSSIASRFGYGTARYSALTGFSLKVRSALPTGKDNLQNAIWGNSGWWRDSGQSLNRLFAQWVAEKSSLQPDLLITEWQPTREYSARLSDQVLSRGVRATN